jgi:predicted dehydrogenase
MFSRRQFVVSGALATAASQVQPSVQAAGPAGADATIRVGVMGLSRGMSLAQDFAKLNGVEVSYLCDVDSRRANASAKRLSEETGQQAKVVTDFRQILEDPQVDALVCAAPNHWHAPATIMACKAGKHVYVEKPCSHNGQEGEWMVQAAERFGKCVQMGTQRRSAPGTRSAIAKLHQGAIGDIHLARCYYSGLRGSIGEGTETQPPGELDYDLWQGPVPRKAYRSNVVHYNWHWFWHWGGGELANNGVHGLDLCRWGLQVDYPTQAISSGGRYWFSDDQETPDLQAAVFEFDGKKQITWDATSCNKHSVDYFCAFLGNQGTLELDENGKYRIYDRQDKLIEEGGQPAGGQIEHLQNFVDCIRSGSSEGLNQPILEGHKSTLLCHLGNIAYRTGQTVNVDPATGHIRDNPQQQAMWGREYDKAWAEAVSMS